MMKTAKLEIPRGFNAEEPEQIRKGFETFRGINDSIWLAARMRRLAAEGRIKLGSEGRPRGVKHPPTFPGKSLSEYLKDVRE